MRNILCFGLALASAPALAAEPWSVTGTNMECVARAATSHSRLSIERKPHVLNATLIWSDAEFNAVPKYQPTPVTVRFLGTDKALKAEPIFLTEEGGQTAVVITVQLDALDAMAKADILVMEMANGDLLGGVRLTGSADAVTRLDTCAAKLEGFKRY